MANIGRSGDVRHSKQCEFLAPLEKRGSQPANPFRPRVMRLPTRTALSQAAEYELGKDVRSHVATTVFGIEVFGRRGSHCFVHGLSCHSQRLDALPNLHQHVTIVFQICAGSYRPVARDDFSSAGRSDSEFDQGNKSGHRLSLPMPDR